MTENREIYSPKALLAGILAYRNRYLRQKAVFSAILGVTLGQEVLPP
jgi:hypothetical protein